MSATLPRRTLASVFLRSFMIQGSWNYHTMLGSGFAFAILPALRYLYGSDRNDLDRSVERHLEHFNAHPYLTGVALGAAVRLEADGVDPETLRRFKVAVRGPLGSLGDALVWATWLPGVALLALALYWLGLPGWLAVGSFLTVYNVGHVALRFWGFKVGLSEGRDVGGRLARADLAGWTARLESGVVLLLGVVVGALLTADRGLADAGTPWMALSVCAFLAGLVVGHRAWRPAAVSVVAAIVLVTAWGFVP